MGLIVDVWLVKVGPWGIARLGVQDVRGFERIVWRLWRRIKGNPLALPVDPLADPVVMLPTSKPAMHWSAGPFLGPACRASGHQLVTVEIEEMQRAMEPEHGSTLPWTPCGRCLQLGVPMMLAYQLNTR